jgi:hypothetical protein
VNSTLSTSSFSSFRKTVLASCSSSSRCPHHCFTIGDLSLGARVNDLFLDGFVDGEQAPKVDEGLLARFS